MNKLQIFKNEEFGEIRGLEINNEPYFIGKDIAEILGYKNTRDALNKHVDNEDKGVTKCDTLGGIQELTVINESGLYSLIMGSKLPSAKKFKRWITSEVLPSIRKTGGYIAGEENMNEDELVLKAMEVMQNKLKRLEDKTNRLEAENNAQFQLIGELKPKADYTDIILKNKSLIKIKAIAKDYGMTANAMNKKLHELKIQYKEGDQWFLYKEHQNKGYTSSETIYLTHTDGTEFTKLNTKWTQKGRLFLYEILKKNGIVPTIEKN